MIISHKGIKSVGLTSFYVMLSVTSLAFLQWVIMAMIGHFTGPEALGNYALAQAFSTPLSYLAWLSIRQQLIISSTETKKNSDYMFLRVWVPAILFPIGLSLIAAIYKDATLISVSILVFSIRYIEGFFDLAYGRMQQSGDARGLGIHTLTRCFTLSILFFVAFRVSGDLSTSLLLLLVASALIYQIQKNKLGIDPWDRKLINLSKSNLERSAHLAKDLLPFGISLVLMSTVTNLPRALLDESLGARQLGFFAATSHFVAMGALMVGSLGHAIMPSLARAVKGGQQRQFWTILLATMGLVTLGCAIGGVLALHIGSYVIQAIYGAEFVGLGGLLVWASAASAPIFVASLASNGLYATQMKRPIILAQFGALVTVIPAVFAFVGQMGVVGAFLGMACAAAVQTAICLLYLTSFWRSAPEGDSRLAAS